MSAHTPGPWVTHEEDGEIGIVEALTKDRRHVKREVCYVFDPQGDSQSAANLRLIAAAPDLLAALMEIAHGCLRNGRVDLDAIDRVARAAIAKARGQ